MDASECAPEVANRPVVDARRLRVGSMMGSLVPDPEKELWPRWIASMVSRGEGVHTRPQGPAAGRTGVGATRVCPNSFTEVRPVPEVEVVCEWGEPLEFCDTEALQRC